LEFYLPAHPIVRRQLEKKVQSHQKFCFADIKQVEAVSKSVKVTEKKLATWLESLAA
jgi:tRNA A58 N-methylase Trm61